MPNWCDNELRIYGQKRDREEFARFVQAPNRFSGESMIFSFESILPYPQKYKDMDAARDRMPDGPEKWKAKDGYNSGGYEWCISTWGTKWDASQTTRQDFKESILYKFDTAWSPPQPVIDAFAKRFPNLKFQLKYFERGMGFQGKYYIQGDDVIVDDKYDYRGSRGG